MARGYWVIGALGYPDTKSDYEHAPTRADVRPLDGPGDYLPYPDVFVYHGEREPWDEHDAYPDWRVSRGPRGGIVWERA